MVDKTGGPYNRAALHGRVPNDRAELFIGYLPGAAEVRAKRVLEQRDERPGTIVSRTAWHTSHDAQLVVEVAETIDADAAIDALLERLSWNELAEVPESPNRVGLVCFAHPKGVPPALYFVRGNLEIAVMGGDPADDVFAVAAAIDERLSTPWPPEVEASEFAEAIQLEVPDGERDAEVFVRIEVQGARARLDDQHRSIAIAGRGRVRAARIGRRELQSAGLRLK